MSGRCLRIAEVLPEFRYEALFLGPYLTDFAPDFLDFLKAWKNCPELGSGGVGRKLSLLGRKRRAELSASEVVRADDRRTGFSLQSPGLLLAR